MDFNAVVEVVTGNTFNTAGHELNDLPCKVCHRKVSVATTAHGCTGPLIHGLSGGWFLISGPVCVFFLEGSLMI